MGSRIPLSEVKRHPHGAVFDDPPVYVEPTRSRLRDRLDVGNADMMADLGFVAAHQMRQGRLIEGDLQERCVPPREPPRDAHVQLVPQRPHR